MIKLKLKAGKFFGEENYGIRVIAIDIDDNNRFCDALFSFSSLNKLSKKSINALMENIEYSFNQCVLGLHGRIPTIDYPPIFSEDKIKK